MGLSKSKNNLLTLDEGSTSTEKIFSKIDKYINSTNCDIDVFSHYDTVEDYIRSMCGKSSREISCAIMSIIKNKLPEEASDKYLNANVWRNSSRIRRILGTPKIVSQGVNGFLGYFEKFPFLGVKIYKNTNEYALEETLRETYAGLIGIEKIVDEHQIPNFMRVFGLVTSTCGLTSQHSSGQYVGREKHATRWCDGVMLDDRFTSSSFTLIEFFHDAIPLSKYIKSAPLLNFEGCIMQITYAYISAFSLVGFYNTDLHCDNIIVIDVPTSSQETTIAYDYDESEGVRYVKVRDKIIKFIDYGYVYFDAKFVEFKESLELLFSHMLDIIEDGGDDKNIQIKYLNKVLDSILDCADVDEIEELVIGNLKTYHSHVGKIGDAYLNVNNCPKSIGETKSVVSYASASEAAIIAGVNPSKMATEIIETSNEIIDANIKTINRCINNFKSDSSMTKLFIRHVSDNKQFKTFVKKLKHFDFLGNVINAVENILEQKYAFKELMQLYPKAFSKGKKHFQLIESFLFSSENGLDEILNYISNDVLEFENNIDDGFNLKSKRAGDLVEDFIDLNENELNELTFSIHRMVVSIEKYISLM